MNKTILTGRITRDPEVRYTANGLANVRFSVAVDRMQKDASGQRMADFINCVAFGQQADFIGRYVKKGNMLAVEGRLQTGNYQGQDGQMRYTTDVIVERVENLTPRDPNAQLGQNTTNYANPTYGANQNNANYQAPNRQPQNETPAMPESFEVADDDLPF